MAVLVAHPLEDLNFVKYDFLKNFLNFPLTPFWLSISRVCEPFSAVGSNSRDMSPRIQLNSRSLKSISVKSILSFGPRLNSLNVSEGMILESSGTENVMV